MYNIFEMISELWMIYPILNLYHEMQSLLYLLKLLIVSDLNFYHLVKDVHEKLNTPKQ